MKSLEELEKLKEGREKELERRKLSIELGFCPVCGSELIEECWEKLDKPVRFLGFVVKRYQVWDKRTVCPRTKLHYEHKKMYDEYYV